VGVPSGSCIFANDMKKGIHMKRLLTASILAASLASGAALAQSPGVGPYVGGSVGSSNYSSDSCVGNCDKTDIGFKVFGGYMFTPYLGAEVGYGAFGKAKVGITGLGNAEIKTSGFHGFLTAQYPVENWAFFGKLGFAWLDNEVTLSTPSASASDSDSSTEFAWGLGLTYMFNKNVGIRGEYENYKYDWRGASDNISLWSLGVQYKF
jgi:OmpA-OmpF porin, OOP family